MKGCKNRILSDSLKSDQRPPRLQERSQVRVPGSTEGKKQAVIKMNAAAAAAAAAVQPLAGGREVSLNMAEDA